jgi:hypothetical protein
MGLRVAKAIHPNNPASFDRVRAAATFRAAQHSKSWLAVARRLRASAQILFDHESPIADRYWAEQQRLVNLRTRNLQAHYDETEFPFPNFGPAYLLAAY